MNSKKILVPLFLIVALIQLAAPGKMIFDREKIVSEGKAFKFRTAPIDPNDPFRGKFVLLNYRDNTFNVKTDSSWTSGETVYVTFKDDAQGFSQINSISRAVPENTPDFLKTQVNYALAHEKPIILNIDFPFNHYYMEETKAPEAETIYTESARDTTKVTYAIVHIKDGDFVLQDVVIGGKPINEIINDNRQKLKNN